jgi:hypothetical protein
MMSAVAGFPVVQAPAPLELTSEPTQTLSTHQNTNQGYKSIVRPAICGRRHLCHPKINHSASARDWQFLQVGSLHCGILRLLVRAKRQAGCPRPTIASADVCPFSDSPEGSLPTPPERWRSSGRFALGYQRWGRIKPVKLTNY